MTSRTPRTIARSGTREFVSEGFGGRPNKFATGQNLTQQLFPRSQITSGARTAFKPIGDGVHVNVTVSGLGTIVEHLNAIAEITGPLLWAGTAEAGRQLEDGMRRIVIEKDIWDTGDTFESIHPEMFDAEDGFWLDVGPTTFYSPFLEYGTSKMASRPFVVPVGDALAPAWVAFCVEVARLADGYLPISNPYGSDPHVRSLISRLRTHLYSEAKALGDVAVLGGRGIINPVRSGMYSLAKGLGDLQSIVGGTVGTRVSHRLRGKVTGRLVGVGAASISFTDTKSAIIGGPAGHRIYTRTVGKHTRFAVTGGGVLF